MNGNDQIIYEENHRTTIQEEYCRRTGYCVSNFENEAFEETTYNDTLYWEIVDEEQINSRSE